MVNQTILFFAGENFGFNIPVLYGLMIPQFLKNISVCDTFCQADERKALIDFYHQTKGPHWLRRKHWNTIKFHCDWEGILCYNRTQHVIAIGLLGNTGMRGEIGNTLGRLPYLLGTGMGGNGLIANITMLLNSFRPFFIRLDFASNKIYGELPNDLATKWPNLGKIQLSRNKDLYGSLPNNIDKLKNLQVLSIGQTGITGRIPVSIARLSKLFFLDLECLSMKGNLEYFKGLYGLNYMHLMSNNINREIPHDFGDWFPKLYQLNLEGNLLWGPVPKSIGNMQNLTVLKLSDNRRLTGQIPFSFANLSNLVILDITGAPK